MSRWSYLSPFLKQSFVASGASINMAASTMLLAYPPGMVLQLKRPDSEIPIDRSIESWIGAMPALSSLLGSFLAAISISRFGRKISQLASITTLIIGWLVIDCAKSADIILIGRFFHGLSLGSSMYLSPILIGEYTSPRYRGALLMLTGVLSAVNVLLAQATGLYLHWRTGAIICTVISSVSLPSAICSPESPSWLAARQRYDDCRCAFRWLRGDDEEEELASMIKASENAHRLKLESTTSKSKLSIKKKLIELRAKILEKAFYKPIIIMVHVSTSGQWSGSNVMTTYVFDFIENILGKGHNEHAMDLNINRVVGAVVAIYIITKTKRRTMFLAFSAANVAVLLTIAAYTFAKSKDVLPFDSPIVGLTLMHLHMFLISTCTLPMPYVIGGEIFPLKYKSIAGGFSIVFVSLNLSIYIKSFPFLLSSVGLHGAYIIYAGIITYCLVISYFYLPETKDRTLQEIEEEIAGKPLLSDELKSVQSLIKKPDTL